MRCATLQIVKVAASDEVRDTPFIAMPQMDLTIEWRALFHGEAVGEAVMFSPVLNLVQAETDANTQLGTGVSWPQKVRDLFPFKLNVVRVQDGLVTFRAPGISTEESLTMRDFQLVLRNLTNERDDEKAAFADIELTGRIMGNAPFKLDGQIDPNEELPAFDVDVSLEDAKLVDVNPWLREFLKVDAEKGAFSMYAELATADGRFEGYVKPILEDPKIFDRKEETSGPFQKAWEAIVGLAAKILENHEEKQVATRIPFSGNLDNPRAGVLVGVRQSRPQRVRGGVRALVGRLDLAARRGSGHRVPQLRGQDGLREERQGGDRERREGRAGAAGIAKARPAPQEQRSPRTLTVPAEVRLCSRSLATLAARRSISRTTGAWRAAAKSGFGRTSSRCARPTAQLRRGCSRAATGPNTRLAIGLHRPARTPADTASRAR